MKTQIICFIKPSIFKGLLGTKKAEEIKFTENDYNHLRIDDQLCIAYIMESGNFVKDNYCEVLANSAIILLVPDDYAFEYKPELPFKVLSHGSTPHKQVTRLKTSNIFFKGHETSHEMTGTRYDEIAQFIVPKTENALSFEYIYEKMVNIPDGIETSLEFLHGCLIGKCDIFLLENAGFDLYTNCTIGTAKDLTVSDLVENFMVNPTDIKLEALRDGVLEMADLKITFADN